LVDADYGSPELAAAYETLSEPQFEHGMALIDLLAIGRDDRVLDVGCGTGRLAAAALERIDAHGRVVGIDPAMPRIALARKRVDSRLEFRAGFAEDLSYFPDASFDVVYLNSVLNWVADPPRAMRQAHRVLGPGGRLGIATTVGDRTNELHTLARRAWKTVRGVKVAAGGSSGDRAPQKEGIKAAAIRSLIEEGGFVVGRFEIRTFTSLFRDTRQICEFLRATTAGRFLGKASQGDIAGFESALAERLAQDFPQALTDEGIRLERYVLLAVADKPGSPVPGRRRRMFSAADRSS
jgi:SAM-dependent methyltransferase